MSDQARNTALERVAGLIAGQRWSALATADNEGPYASAVAYVPEPDFSGFLLHLSSLAPHTRKLRANPLASLLITEPDPGHGDPQQLARLTLNGDVLEIPRGTPDHECSRRLYLQRLPESAPLFGFADFTLFRLMPREARFVGGFAQARRFTRGALAEAAALAADGD